MDADGVVYKGRSTSGTKIDDGDVTAENSSHQGVTAGHAYGHNSGSEGVAVLGNYVAVPIPDRVDGALKDFLFSKASAHGLYAAEISTYTNPTNGVQERFENLPGHLEVPNNDTECPGGAFLDRLRWMRSEMAAVMDATVSATPDRAAPDPPSSLTAKAAKRAVTLTWPAVKTDVGSGGGISGVVGYDIYRKLSDGTVSLLASTAGLTYTDNAPARGVNSYVVKTFDGASNRSLASPTASASV
jgi:hypothetical protein